jgi:hypothetical protein
MTVLLSWQVLQNQDRRSSEARRAAVWSNWSTVDVDDFRRGTGNDITACCHR